MKKREKKKKTEEEEKRGYSKRGEGEPTLFRGLKLLSRRN